MRALTVFILALAFFGIGCNKGDDSAGTVAANPAKGQAAAGVQVHASGSGDSVHPIGSPMAGGMTPMAGGDNIGDSAGSVGQSAVKLAGKASSRASAGENEGPTATAGGEGTTG